MLFLPKQNLENYNYFYIERAIKLWAWRSLGKGRRDFQDLSEIETPTPSRLIAVSSLAVF